MPASLKGRVACTNGYVEFIRGVTKQRIKHGGGLFFSQTTAEVVGVHSDSFTVCFRIGFMIPRQWSPVRGSDCR